MGGVGGPGGDRWPGAAAVPLRVLIALGLVAGCSSGVTTIPPPVSPSDTPSLTGNPLGRGTYDTSVPPPTAPPSTNPTPSVNRVPISSAPFALDGWVERASFAGESLDVLTLGGPGLIAAGSTAPTGAGTTDAVIRLSADGSAWRTAVVQESSGGTIHAIRQVGGAYVALGTRLLGEADFRGAVWTSADAERWDLTATFPMLVPLAIVDRDGQALAWGTRGWTEPSGLVLWTIDDAGRWGAAGQVDLPEEAFLARDVIATGRGYLAFGNRGGVIPAGADRVFVGISLDGRSWRFPEPQESLDRAGFASVVERSDGFLAMGWAAAADAVVPAVWRSGDGLDWSRVPDSTGLTGARLVRAARNEGRIIVRGTFGDGTTSRAATWESSDGSHWTRLSPGADIPSLAGAMSSDPVMYGGRRLVVATLQESSSTRAVVLLQEGLPR